MVEILGVVSYWPLSIHDILTIHPLNFAIFLTLAHSRQSHPSSR